MKNTLKVISSAFSDGGLIPGKYTCQGDNINPPLLIDNVPAEAKSLALIVDDPDAPGRVWTHWVIWNISPEIKEIKRNNVPEGAIVGTNDSGNAKYDGPCPPSGTHRYFFKIYALDTITNLPFGSSRKELESVIVNHILDAGELMGKYSK